MIAYILRIFHGLYILCFSFRFSSFLLYLDTEENILDLLLFHMITPYLLRSYIEHFSASLHIHRLFFFFFFQIQFFADFHLMILIIYY